MIRYIKGEFLYYDTGAIIVETKSGLGFRINISDTSQLLNSNEGDLIQVYTYLQVKEDGISLFGFSDLDELKLFEQLISVNGVGPKAGLSIMSLGTPNQIKSIIAGKDSISITKAQGIGKKTAERIILELSDKVNVIPIDMGNSSEITINNGLTLERKEAVTALTTLGYSKKEAEQAIAAVSEDNLKTEEYVRKALKYLL